MFSDGYRHQTIESSEKLLKQGNAINTIIIVTPILIVIHMYVGLTIFLEDSALDKKYD